MNSNQNSNQTEKRDNEKIIESAVGDIHVPSSKVPFDLNINYLANTPFQFDATSDQAGYGTSTTESGIQKDESPGFFKTAGAEYYNFNATLELGNAAYDKTMQPDPLVDIPPADWTPKSSPESFYDIKPQYEHYLLEAKGPKDLEYRRQRVLSEQEHDQTLENGSTFAKIIGGLAGAFTDPVGWIPIVGWTKYAKFAPTIMKAAGRALPGVATASVIQSAAKQLDKVNGNLSDFILDSGINTLVGSALFGTLGGVGLALDKMELWKLKGLFKDSVKGIDFKFELGAKDEITGIKAFDTTGNINADEVSKAQEIANSSFLKSGFFKVPYLGSALIALKGAPIIGSPLLRMINSPYQSVRAFINLAADHSFVTKGIENGEASPKSFDFFMKKEFADLRSISDQMNALYREYNGFTVKNRTVGSFIQAGMGIYNKGLKVLQKDIEKDGYTPRHEFDDKVQRVLFSGESSEHASVNDAASIIRAKFDSVIKAYNAAHGRKTEILSPKMANEFLSRVYDTPYLNVNKDTFVKVISDYYHQSDQTIALRTQPINALKSELDSMISEHAEFIKKPKITDLEVKLASDAIEKKKIQLKAAEEDLQNELRTNESLKYHVDDWYALSADEAKELTAILKPLNDLKLKVEEQKKIVSQLQNQKAKSKTSAIKGKTVETAKKHAEAETNFDKQILDAESKLNELKNNVSEEDYRLYQMALKGEVDPKFYYPETHQYKNPNERLKFRDVYESHIARENHALASWNTILHTNPEDTIADIMGRVMGTSKENHLKSRTLLVPDQLLYDNNFMTKDLMAKVNNYVLFVSRRTHLKNVYKEVTHEGGIEPLIEKINREYHSIRSPLDARKKELEESITPENEKSVSSEIEKIQKEINNETKRFARQKDDVSLTFERMMGLKKRDKWEIATQGVVRSLVAMSNLHLLLLTQVADLGAIGLQHGTWNFVKDAMYPLITSINGLIKTKDSEAIREVCPHIHLGLQDVINGIADKNISMETQPYLNMGPIVSGIQKMAHFSANMDLSTHIDNMLQRLSGSVIQSKLMACLHKYSKGTITKKDNEYLLKYGIDPKVWSERMINAFKDSKGYKTKLGGYQSLFWKWTDHEAANQFGDAVFKGIQNTIITRGLADSPFWADNMLGMIFHTFTGWGYASINRYVVPALQRPDAEKLLGVLLSLSFGSLVSPFRRMSRGEDAYPDDMSHGQRFYEAVADSAVSSALANVLSYANALSDDRLLGQLKNDKFRNRMGIGASSAVFGTANRIFHFFEALASGTMNIHDAKQMANMLPIAGSLYGRKISDIILNYTGWPENRAQARAEKD